MQLLHLCVCGGKIVHFTDRKEAAQRKAGIIYNKQQVGRALYTNEQRGCCSLSYVSRPSGVGYEVWLDG